MTNVYAHVSPPQSRNRIFLSSPKFHFCPFAVSHIFTLSSGKVCSFSLLMSSICSNILYKWNYVVCILWCQTFFTQHCSHAVHLCYELKSIHYLCLMIFHFMTLTNLLIQSIVDGHLHFSPDLGHYE